MKLKKIASLALAGVMAVSMLAGCNNGSSSNGGNGNTEVVTSSIVDAVNKGQSVANDVKITFTADSDLDSALKRAAEKLGVSANDTKLAAAITNMTGLKVEKPDQAWYRANRVVEVTNVQGLGGLLGSSVVYATDYATNEKVGDEDGKTYTMYGVLKYEGTAYPTEESVLNTFANDVDEFIGTLSKNSDTTDGKLTVTTGKEYYSYSYDGNVSMVAVENTNGVVDHYVAVVLNQTIAEKKL
ncbi:hypothetical protein [Faecalibacterium sp. An192]|uniref:hypothetical protein n=1 Tax=Faecalibacterium sp. An192 TaxID=1965581 RepID=UPI000B3AEBF9|nr:hypothetical protein [Faecalibacterium sp. An192]OUP25832.1 hypothetical protein B5F27_15785 [Faecalibacterium sp. An192]